MKMNLTYQDKFWLTGLAICSIVSAAWFVSDLTMGGSARYGEVVQGKYFVANHGVMTEVSERCWRLNLWLNGFARVTLPLAFVFFIFAKRPIGKIAATMNERMDKSEFWNQTTGAA